MEAKEKAKELVDRFIQYTPAEEEYEFEYAKECALIAVDEILSELSNHRDILGIRLNTLYYQEVKQEILKL